jgi:peptidoglycan hydrolase-like protein with peptidoglycan-binding domain
MRTRLIPFVVLACFTGSCHHAQTTRPTEQGEGGSSSSGGDRTSVPPRPGGPPVSGAPSGLLAPDAARRVQDALRSKGLYDREPTGKVDSATTDAIRRFQREQGLVETGWPDYETVRKLGLDPDTVYRENRAARKDPAAKG